VHLSPSIWPGHWVRDPSPRREHRPRLAARQHRADRQSVRVAADPRPWSAQRGLVSRFHRVRSSAGRSPSAHWRKSVRQESYSTPWTRRPGPRPH